MEQTCSVAGLKGPLVDLQFLATEHGAWLRLDKDMHVMVKYSMLMLSCPHIFAVFILRVAC